MGSLLTYLLSVYVPTLAPVGGGSYAGSEFSLMLGELSLS